jgi:hypothetical protein
LPSNPVRSLFYVAEGEVPSVQPAGCRRYRR